MTDMDELGDRCKAFERASTDQRAMPGLPLLARLDGRAFHTFTRGLKRPFDDAFAGCMRQTAASLVEEFHAAVGYTQSDEITLAWYIPAAARDSQYPFDGRYQKLTSVLAGWASATFTRQVDAALPEKSKALPVFDCRVWQVPTLDDAVDVFRWREWDAVKNSISVAAQSVASHKALHGVGSRQKLDMLIAHGINWNEYPAHFKRGIYLQRGVETRSLTEEERMRIPEKHRPAADATFARGVTRVLDLPPITKVPNAAEVLFGISP